MRERPWNGRCHRCGKETSCHIMSMFNTELICMDCAEKEENRPDYEDANAADVAAIKQGNYNFEGVGMK